MAEDLLWAAEKAVDLTGCGWPFGYLCDAVDDAQDEVDDAMADVRRYQTQITNAERLLDRYNIQLTLVGAEFTASLSAFEGANVTMNLIVDANGSRYPVTVSWDFDETIKTNLDGAIDELVPA